MALETTFSCPLGSECETVEGKTVVRCAWYMKLSGVDRNTGKEIDDWGCSIAWLPTLMVDVGNQARSSTSAFESMRNETVKGQAQFLDLIAKARNDRLTEK